MTITSNDSNPPLSKRHSCECRCDTCYQSKSGYYEQFENPTLEQVVYQLIQMVPFLRNQIRFVDENLMTLGELLAKRKELERAKPRK